MSLGNLDRLFVKLEEALSSDAHKGVKVSGIVDALTTIKNVITKPDPYLEYSAILISVKEYDVQDVVTREDFGGYQDFLTDGIKHFSCQIFMERYEVHMGFYFELFRAFELFIIQSALNTKAFFLEYSYVFEDFTEIFAKIYENDEQMSSALGPVVLLDIKDLDASNEYFSNLLCLQRLLLEIVNTLEAPFKGNTSKYEYHVNVC
jgi:hypothetical protein